MILIPFDVSFLVQLCGIVVGHLYFFLVFKYPQDFGGAHYLQTPSFLYGSFRFSPPEFVHRFSL